MDTQTGENRFLRRATGENIRGRQGQKVSPLYRWMVKNFEDIREARQTIRAWDVFIEIANEDGITETVENKAITRKTAAKTWARVQRAKAAQPHDMMHGDRQPTSPSRLPKNWKPDFIDRDPGTWSPDESGIPAKNDHAEKSASQVASLPATIPVGSGGNTTGEEEFPVGRARAEGIKRDLLARLRKKEPGFHRE